ncbi:MAG: hypothetical protein ACU843_04875 [Gammaproteobacteria bacterium]
MSQKMIFVQIFLLVVLIALNGCANRIMDVAQQKNINSLMGTDKTGNPVVIDLENQDEMAACEPREQIDSAPGGAMQMSDKAMCKTVVKRTDGKVSLLDSSGKKMKVNSVVEALIISYPGSECVTYFINGRQWEICK